MNIKYIFKICCLLLISIGFPIRLYSQKVIVDANTYTVCGSEDITITIRENGPSNDGFKNSDQPGGTTLFQYYSIGFSTSDFEFDVTNIVEKDVSIDYFDDGSPISNVVVTKFKKNSDITTAVFTFSYTMLNTVNDVGRFVISGLKIKKSATAAWNANATMKRIPLLFTPIAAEGKSSAFQYDNEISDHQTHANLNSPIGPVLKNIGSSTVCPGGQFQFNLSNIFSGATKFELYNDANDDGIGTNDSKAADKTIGSDGNFTHSPPTTNSTDRHYYIKATDEDHGCFVYSNIIDVTVTDPPQLNLGVVPWMHCVGSKDELIFNVENVPNSTYQLYCDNPSANTEITAITSNFPPGSTNGVIRYFPPDQIDGKVINYYVKATPTGGGCARTSADIPVIYSAPIVSSVYNATTPKLIFSSDGPTTLSSLITKESGLAVTFSATPGKSPSATDGLTNSNTEFDPEGLSSGQYFIDYFVTNTTTHCVSETKTLSIQVIDGNNTLPYFLRNIDRMPICENMPKDTFQLFALISKACADNLTNSSKMIVQVYDNTVPTGQYVSVVADHVVKYDTTLGGTKYYGYAFSIRPKHNIGYAIKVVFNSGCGNDYQGFIPINPRRDPKLTGLPEKLPTDTAHFICSSSNDSLFIRGNPVGGFYHFYQGKYNKVTKKYDYTPLGTTLSPNAPPKNDLSLERFTPSHIFHNRLNSDDSLFIKVVYTVPEDTKGSCPDSISKYLFFTPSVDVKFETPKILCYGTAVEFNVKYGSSSLRDNPVQDKFYWNFNDGFTVNYDTISKQVHNFLAPGEYKIRFKTELAALVTKSSDEMCNFDTIQTIRVGAQPKADFSVTKNYFDPNSLINPNTVFKTSSRIDVATITGVDEIVSWVYKFGTDNNDTYEGNTIAEADATFKYPLEIKKDPYTVTHIVKATHGCIDSISYKIPVFPIRNPYEDKFHLDTFDVADLNGWYHSGQYALSNPKSSWVNDTLKGKIISSITENNAAWATLKPKDTITANYYSDEHSWVESPVFDISHLSWPMVSLNTFMNTDPNFDGASLQYAFCDNVPFGAENWKTLGDYKHGLNWYNSKLILGLQKDQLFGWTGKTQKEWQLSAYRLDEIKALMNSTNTLIRFRLLLGTNGDNDVDYPFFEGFAFDNFFVGQRNRRVVVEEFCDYEKFETQNKFTDGQAINIQYHTSLFKNDDEINLLSPDEPDARALHYGIGKALPRGVVDGIYFDNDSLLSKWGPDEFFRRSLIVSPLKLGITTGLNKKGDSLTVNVELEKLNQSLEEKNLLVHIAIVEQSTTGNGNPFTNVLRSLVPNAAGTRIDKTETWKTKAVNGAWKPFANLKPKSDFNIIAFVQDEQTKEIYQAGIKTVGLDTINDLSKKKSGAFNEEISFDEVYVSPNPTIGDVRLIFNGILNENYHWQIFDTYGRLISDGDLNKGTNASFISTANMGSGVYIIKLDGEGRSITKRFSVVK